jgi:hypothetical protein
LAADTAATTEAAATATAWHREAGRAFASAEILRPFEIPNILDLRMLLKRVSLHPLEVYVRNLVKFQ